MGAGVVLWGCFWSGLGQVRTGQRRDRQDGSRPRILLLLLLLIFFLIHPCSASYKLSFANLEMFLEMFLQHLHRNWLDFFWTQVQ